VTDDDDVAGTTADAPADTAGGDEDGGTPRRGWWQRTFGA
jgi:ribonuclease E